MDEAGRLLGPVDFVFPSFGQIPIGRLANRAQIRLLRHPGSETLRNMTVASVRQGRGGSGEPAGATERRKHGGWNPHDISSLAR
jgi:hypothetical protein